MNKIGLVLEGGGMRGAYTAGTLAWMIDNKIEVDYGAGISAGAMNLCLYFMKDTKLLYDITVVHTSDKRNVGLTPLFKEGRYVGYDYMFDDLLLKQIKLDCSSLRTNHAPLEMGLYNMNTCDIEYYGSNALDDHLRLLKASCTLPIAGRIVDVQGKPMLDGGIKVMIPIERAIEKGCTKNIVIITKPEGYVRKPASGFMRWFMNVNYPKYPKMVNDYIHRHEQYERQMAIIDQQVETQQAFLVRPSQEIPVKRFSGDPENLKRLFELGYADMESRKEELLAFMNKG